METDERVIRFVYPNMFKIYSRLFEFGSMSRKNHIHKKVSVHQNVTTTMTLQNHSVKRPGRSRRRRQNRKNRKINHDRDEKSATIIQKRFRWYLENRYKEECPNNYDDHDYINLEKVSHIPKKLLVSMDGTGYNALSLLGWFCCKQVDPVTRKPIDDTVPTECAAKILGFIKNDGVFKKKKGHFKRRKKYADVIKKCVKITLG